MKILTQCGIANIEMDDNGTGIEFIRQKLSDLIGVDVNAAEFGAYYLGIVNEDYEDPAVQRLFEQGIAKEQLQAYRQSLARAMGYDAAEVCRREVQA